LESRVAQAHSGPSGSAHTPGRAVPTAPCARVVLVDGGQIRAFERIQGPLPGRRMAAAMHATGIEAPPNQSTSGALLRGSGEVRAASLVLPAAAPPGRVGAGGGGKRQQRSARPCPRLAGPWDTVLNLVRCGRGSDNGCARRHCGRVVVEEALMGTRQPDGSRGRAVWPEFRIELRELLADITMA